MERSEGRAVTAYLGTTAGFARPTKSHGVSIQNRDTHLTQPQEAQAAAGEPLLQIRSVAKSFGARAVLRDVSLDVAPGEFLTILGESGSGKTTLLRLIAGFERPDTGEIWMGASGWTGYLPIAGRLTLFSSTMRSFRIYPSSKTSRMGCARKVWRKPRLPSGSSRPSPWSR